MKIAVDLKVPAKLLSIVLMVIAAIYLLRGAGGMAAGSAENQAARVSGLVEKALLQCYALEGAYPVNSQFEEKMGKYGVILNHEKYNFQYDFTDGKAMPDFSVVPVGPWGRGGSK